MTPVVAFAAILALSHPALAHVAAWHKAMYCRNGLSTADQPNTYWPTIPIWNNTYDEWFMHGECRNYPPPPGEFLDLPAGGKFTIELASNRAFTSLSYGGRLITGWGDGQHHPDDYSSKNPGGAPLSSLGCIGTPNIHTHGEWDAAGTAFAIAYKSDINAVTMDDLVVFTVAPHTPYKLHAKYEVPEGMPACPEDGCICAWGWVPNHCGQSNVYMHPYRCRVTGAHENALPLAPPRSPVWCEDDPSRCVRGAKKMVIYYQREGNTIDLTGVELQRDGSRPSPGYNMKMGFHPGAQVDIFENPVEYIQNEPSGACAAPSSDAATLAQAPLQAIPQPESGPSEAKSPELYLQVVFDIPHMPACH